MRQHALGPYPLDPNLIAQGIPPDDRATFGDHTYGPVDGTPLPPGAAPSGTPPDAAPSSLTTDGPAANPPVAVARYDPRTGNYTAAGGRLFQQSNLAAAAAPKSWQDMLPR